MKKVPRYKRINKRNDSYNFEINKIKNILEEISKNIQETKTDKKSKFNIDWFSKISLVISMVALVISIKALNYDNLSIILSATEPILNIELDEYKNNITISNKTYKIFDIRHVTFGKARPFALYNSYDILDNKLYRVIDVPFLETHFNLEEGHTEETNMNSKEAAIYNKKMYLELDKYNTIFSEETLYNAKRYIEENITLYTSEYLPVYKFYDYFYLIIHYTDKYGNRGIQFYIYNHEYANTIKKYKLSQEEFYSFISQMIQSTELLCDINTKDCLNEEKLLRLMLSEDSYISEDNPKYIIDAYDHIYFDFLEYK